MEKVWVNTEKGEDRIIAISSDTILKVNPKENKIYRVEEAIRNDEIPNDAFCIPFSYVKSVRLQENKPYIQVFFGLESEEYFRIKDYNNPVNINFQIKLAEK
jgi:hypothetical protein